MSSAPRVSVVIPAYLSQATVEACLQGLENQTYTDAETIVVDTSPDQRTADAVRRFPAVKLVRPGRRMLPHEAKNEGARRARGSILVFTDPDCVASSDWLARLVAMHDEGWKAAGGAVKPAAGRWNLAVHWCRYGWWLAGGRPRLRTELASANSSFSRELWATVGGYDGAFWAGDSELCWRLRKLGVPLRFDPAAILTHYHPMPPLDLLRDRFSRGRDYGRLRARARGWSRARAAAQLPAAPIAPVVMTLRAARFASEAGRLLEWALFAPVQWAAHTAWCAGEATSLAEAAWKR